MPLLQISFLLIRVASFQPYSRKYHTQLERHHARLNIGRQIRFHISSPLQQISVKSILKHLISQTMAEGHDQFFLFKSALLLPGQFLHPFIYPEQNHFPNVIILQKLSFDLVLVPFISDNNRVLMLFQDLRSADL